MSSLFNLFGAPSDESQEQQTRRPTTRSQSRSNTPHLEIPADAISNFNGVARGRRSPSPLHVGHNANSRVIFAYDSTNVSERVLQSQHDNAESIASVDGSSAASSTAEMAAPPASIDELRANAAAAVEAANAATQALMAATGLVVQQTQQQQQQIRTRKPDLPEFDSKNVEIWIKRVQAAYDRAGISLAKDKFAFLETKFAVGANPSIDEFLYGPANEEKWNDFLSYLRSEYGRTVRQEAQFIRGQFSRDGRRPSQMLSHIKEKVKRVTVDDILKEIIVSSLPTDVQQMIQERVKDLSADQTAHLADHYFDQEGRVLHSRSSNVNQVDASSHNDDHDDDCEDGDINAIGGRRGNFRGPPRNNNNNSRFSKPFSNNGPSRRGNNNNNNNRQSNRSLYNPRSSSNGAHSAAPPNTSSAPHAAASSSKVPIVCMSHQRYGDKSYTCQQGCSLWPEFQRRQAGKGNAGKRQ